jgi:hypothetical protein
VDGSLVCLLTGIFFFWLARFFARSLSLSELRLLFFVRSRATNPKSPVIVILALAQLGFLIELRVPAKANYRRLEVDHDKLRDKLTKVQKAPTAAAPASKGSKAALSAARGLSLTDASASALPLLPPPTWSAVTAAEGAAAAARAALLLQENAKLTEAMREMQEQVGAKRGSR